MDNASALFGTLVVERSSRPSLLKFILLDFARPWPVLFSPRSKADSRGF